MTSEQAARPISITLEARPVLSYAMAHNEIPVISRLAIEHVPTDVQAARLRLEVADASGSIGAPQEILLDLRAGQPTVLTDLKLLLEPAAMLQVEEQRPAAIRARLEIDGELRAEQVFRTRVLAAHQWLATPPALALEMLAAHVMPNHPAITALMPEVAQRLQASTGSPSLEGYQSGPERVDQIVAAVYAAMQARGIRYAEPAASWADIGQKVRTPGEVLDDRVGTCLDTVVVMAAALEQAGVRPLIWLVDGHAFLGYWREALSLGTVAEFDTGGVVNRIDLGQIGLVETTVLTVRPDPVPFAEAQRMPYAAHLTGDLEQRHRRHRRPPGASGPHHPAAGADARRRRPGRSSPRTRPRRRTHRGTRRRPRPGRAAPGQDHRAARGSPSGRTLCST